MVCTTEHQQRMSERVSHVCEKLEVFDTHGGSGGGAFRSHMSGIYLITLSHRCLRRRFVQRLNAVLSANEPHPGGSRS
jgi:hypothetical protein